MVVNRKVTGKAASMPAGIALGGLTSLAITLLSAGILAKMIETEALAEENVGYGVMVLLLTASASGAMIAKKRVKRQRLLVCMLSGVCYLGILLSITALFFGGQYDAVGVTALLVFGGSLLTALLDGKERRGGKRPKMRAYHR